jgi:hypothetical protein
MEFKNDDLKVSFTIPDKITIRQRLQYDSVAYGNSAVNMLERLWQAAIIIVQDWQAPIPVDIDLDMAGEDGAAAVVEWVGRAVFSRMYEMKELPKNS